MTRNRKLLLGGIAIAAVTAGAIGASAHRGGWGPGGPGGPGGFHGRHGGGFGLMGPACGGNAAEMTDHMLVRLEYKVKPTDAQKGAFEELKTAARAAAAKAAAGCPPKPTPTADGTRPPRKPPTERLALMEKALAAQLDAVRTVRPAADKFYASLSDEQKKSFTEVPPGRGPGRHRGGPGFEHGMRGDGPQPPAPQAPDKK